MSGRQVLLFFVDGLGIGEASPANPLDSKDRPVLSLIGKLRRMGPFRVDAFAAKALDATLGVPGLPQSATGQSALLTGVNASAHLGRHLNGFPNAALRKLLSRHSIFAKLARRGLVGNFANAFTPEFFPALDRERLSVTTWAALAGGRQLRSLHDLRAGRAVYQDFTNLHLQMRGLDAPLLDASRAGQILAGLLGKQDFLLYEYFITDFAGHAQDPEFAGTVLDLLDRFAEALLENADLGRSTVLLTSDHGNIEDLSVKSHTLNPVPLLAWGPGAHLIADRCESIVDVTPAILAWLDKAPRDGEHAGAAPGAAN